VVIGAASQLSFILVSPFVMKIPQIMGQKNGTKEAEKHLGGL